MRAACEEEQLTHEGESIKRANAGMLSLNAAGRPNSFRCLQLSISFQDLRSYQRAEAVSGAQMLLYFSTIRSSSLSMVYVSCTCLVWQAMIQPTPPLLAGSASP